MGHQTNVELFKFLILKVFIIAFKSLFFYSPIYVNSVQKQKKKRKTYRP